MSDHEDPHWDQLPGDPEAFFGLAGEYDLRDLKRSYNQLIRRFKPEKFPQEFQRIRAAYELLNDALRFNLPTGTNLPPPMPPVEACSSELAGASRPGETKPPVVHRSPAETVALTVRETLQETPPAEVYRELREKAVKTPADYVALAFLSDVVGAKAKSGLPAFSEWLLAGLKKHPRDWGLTQLVREFLSGPHSLAELAVFLQRTADAISPERFQYATERAWDRLLREGTFEEFGPCLRHCADRLGKAIGHWQLIFFVHVLPTCVWKADHDCVDEMRATVEDHFHSLEPWGQLKYETISMLFDYLGQRESFVARGPACRRIDEAIRDWCLLPETQADLSVLDCLYFISQRGQRLLDEFPDSKEQLTPVVLLWEHITSDVLERQEDPGPPESGEVVQSTREFMIRVHRRNSRTGPYYRGLAMVYAALTLVATSLVTSAALLVRLCWKLFGEGRIGSGLLDGLLAVVLLVLGFVSAIAVFLFGRVSLKLSYDPIRGEVIKLLRAVPLPLHEVAVALEERENEKFGEDNDSTIDDTALVARALREDPAMILFSIAQVCMHAAASIPVVEAQIVEPDVVELAEAVIRPPSRPVGARLR